MFEATNLIDNLKNIDYLPNRIINLLKEKQFSSEEDFYRFYEELLLSYTNSYLLKGKFVEFYPIVRNRVAKCDFSCQLSGTKIRQGSAYITYHPFVEDFGNKRVYVIKKEIKALPDFLDILPTNMAMYEEWYIKLQNCISYESMNGGRVDFYNLSVECGENCLDLYPLNLSKKRRIKH